MPFTPVFSKVPANPLEWARYLRTIRNENGSVQNAELRDSAALSVIGRSASTSGSPADISASANEQLLIRRGNALAFSYLHDRTTAETAAGITPTNYYYPPGHVLRYGTNTTPGTTDMTAAVQSACDVYLADESVQHVYVSGAVYCATDVPDVRRVPLRGPGFIQIGAGQPLRAEPVEYRVLDDEYPERIDGAVNIFIGADDPGIAMEEGDYWANPDGTTLAEVVSEAENEYSDLYAAIQTAASPNIFIPAQSMAVIDNRPPAFDSFSPSANNAASVAGWFFDDSSTEIVGGLVATPIGWSAVRVRLLWSHRIGSPSGNVVWLVQCSALASGTDLSVAGVNHSDESECPALLEVQELVIPDVAEVDTAGDLLRVAVARVGATSADTFTGDAGLIGVFVERTA